MGSGTRASGGARSAGISTEMAWSALSFALMAAAGAGAYAVIGRFYGPEALGVFSQAYAVYVVLSQVVVLGVQFSVLCNAAALGGAEQEMRAMVWGALWLVLFSAGITALSGGLALHLWRESFAERQLPVALLAAAPGLVFFSFNKVVISWLNGIGRIRAVALAQGARGLLIIAWTAILVVLEVPAAWLSGALSMAEASLGVALAASCLRGLAPVAGRAACAWAARHARFGLRALGTGVILECNGRIDVLMLGWYHTDRVVGIYSIAGLGLEAMLQLCQLMRISWNPRFARLYAARRPRALQRMARAVRDVAFRLLAPLAILAVCLYPWLTAVVLGEAFAAGTTCFAVLMFGFAVTSGYRPLDLLLMQTGRPGRQTAVLGGTMLVNVVLNALLIPHYGMLGAATAMAASTLVGTLFLRAAVRRSVGVLI